jgi:hypothetical protein
MYTPVIYHFPVNNTRYNLSFIGQSLPAFPYVELQTGLSTNFYLREAGTINITVINNSGGFTFFQYMVKDTALGYPIETGLNSYVKEAVVRVPRDRNYSIMIFPNNSMPISFDWSNFSSPRSYNFTTVNNQVYRSYYENATHTVHKIFNTTEKFVRVTGYIHNNTAGKIYNNWNDFIIVPFLLEPGNMVFFSDNAAMPLNMSSWRPVQQSDTFNLTNNAGFYNITLLGSAESVKYMLYSTARNGSQVYGGYRNITLGYSSSDINGFNFTMYGLLNNSAWASAEGNITMVSASNWAMKNISSAKFTFNFVNSTNHSLSQTSVHVETKIDYSSFMNVTEFTIMMDTSQASTTATISMPLLNITGIKEMNIFTTGKAPRRLDTMTAAQVVNNKNISLSVFNPGDIGGALNENQISVTIYKSNSTCDVPVPPTACILTSSTTMDSFNPLNAIIGGGRISFRMGTSSIVVHYVNVDMLASGPPDGLFDNEAGASESASSFSNAMKFGSQGPKIYDYVLVSMPYLEAQGTGLNDSANVTFSIPIFYDENWNTIWSNTNNSSSASALAGNYSHYSDHQTEWQELMGSNGCLNSSVSPNTTDPCHINTTANKIWIRLPHFSGTGASIGGNLIPAATTIGTTSSSSSGGSAAVTASTWLNTYVMTDEQFIEGFTKELSANNRVKIKIDNEEHFVGVKNITGEKAIIEISSDPVTVVLDIGDEAKVDVTEDNYYDIYVKLEGISNNKANVSVQSIHEEIPEDAEGNIATTGDVVGRAGDESATGEFSWRWILAIIVIIVILAIVGYVVYNKKDRKKNFGF